MKERLHWLRLKRLCIILSAVALFSSCSTIVPNIEAVSPVSGMPGVAAIAQNTNSDDHRRLNIEEWMDFLYAREAIVDAHDPSSNREAKGPAVCFSSEDYQKNETALAQLCIKGSCTYEQKKALARIQQFRAESYEIEGLQKPLQ